MLSGLTTACAPGLGFLLFGRLLYGLGIGVVSEANSFKGVVDSDHGISVEKNSIPSNWFVGKRIPCKRHLRVFDSFYLVEDVYVFQLLVFDCTIFHLESHFWL